MYTFRSHLCIIFFQTHCRGANTPLVFFSDTHQQPNTKPETDHEGPDHKKELLVDQ